MSNYQKSITKSVRVEYGRFPNVEAARRLELGQVGTFDGKSAQFTWLRKLQDFGITQKQLTPDDIEGFVDEEFSIGEQTSVIFGAKENGLGYASLSLGTARSMIAQATSMRCLYLDEWHTRQAIIEAIESGTNWSSDYLVITHLFVADSYSQFFSLSKGAEAEVNTSLPTTGRFNLANGNLGLSIGNRKGSIHSLLAQENVTPFFMVQKLKGWKKEYKYKPDWTPQDLRLEPYGC